MNAGSGHPGSSANARNNLLGRSPSSRRHGYGAHNTSHFGSNHEPSECSSGDELDRVSFASPYAARGRATNQRLTRHDSSRSTPGSVSSLYSRAGDSDEASVTGHVVKPKKRDTSQSKTGLKETAKQSSQRLHMQKSGALGAVESSGALRGNSAGARGFKTSAGGGNRSNLGDDASTLDSNASDDCHSRANTATFADQLFATLARSFRELLRSKCSVVVELIVPIVFVAITVALWAVWGDTAIETSYYVNYTSPDLAKSPAAAADARQYFCYGPNVSEPTPGLMPCNAALANYTCDGVDTYVPLKGDALCAYAASFKTLILSYIFSIRGPLTRIPSLDSMILYQWGAMKAGSLLLSDTFGETFITNRQVFSIDKGGRLYLAGEDDDVLQALMQALRKQSIYFPMIYGGRYRTVGDAKADMKNHSKNWGIIEVRSFSKTEYDVVIHLAAKGMADTSQSVDITYSGGIQENGADLYLSSGYLTLAQSVAEFYLEHVHGESIGFDNFVVSNASPAYKFSPMLRYAYGLVPLVFVLAFLYSVSQQTKRTVLEKELRIREAMLIMGMKDAPLYISTFIVNGSMLTIVCIASTALVKATLLSKADTWCLFLFFWMFAITTIPLSGLIASFFSKARLATLMAPVIYFIIVMPTFVVTSSNGAVTTGFAVLSPSAFASIVNSVLRHQLGDGFASKDLNNTHDNPTIAVLLAMLVADFFVYYLLMLYFDAVLPKEWGTAKHPLFFLIDPFKACCCRNKKRLYGGADGRAEDGVFEDDGYGDDVVQITGLRKEYKRDGKKFIAVNNFYWGMQGSEISVLLGHNGAGKTTALNMMTGMIEPDEGDCYVYGLSVRQELSLVRNEIGYCPQHNILWSELTCRDHLEFYGRLKGLKGWELENAVCRMLYETDLFDKMNYKSKDLSGGQKRKLSISVAFVGGSRLVFLDEPTAGMDVGARRYLWALLKNMSQYHTMLLTTHYMDEADLLGQRIGIMSHGRLKCSGSSMFLKSRLGVGYSITISVNPETNARDVDDLIMTYVADANVLSHNGCELAYQLPMKDAACFPQLLGAIEANDSVFGIRGYSLAATTLEEVFLKVSEDKDAVAAALEKPSIGPLWKYERSKHLIQDQIRAMFMKRIWNALRDRRMLCFQIICPVVCVLVAMLLALIRVHGQEELVLNHAIVYNRDKNDANFPTAQCETWWGGNDTKVIGTVHEETHYPNAQQLSYAMLDRWNYHSSPTYGGIACQDRDLSVFTQRPFTNVLIYNGSGPHQSGINLATLYDMFTRSLTDNRTTMKMTAGVMRDPKDVIKDPMNMLVTGLLIMIPFTFLPSNPVAWIVKERECGAKHQQILAGLNFYVYWVCNFVFDLAAYLFAAALIIILFLIFQKAEFAGKDRIGATCALFIVFGFTSTTMAYFMSFWFKEHSAAQTATMGGCLAVAFLLLVVTYVLQLKPELEDTAYTLRWVFRLMPTFCVGDGIMQLMLLEQLMDAGQSTGIWTMQPFGYTLIYLAVEFPVFGILALLLDHPRLQRTVEGCRYRRDSSPVIPSDEDSDVEDERLAVYEAETRIEDKTDVLRVVDLQKKYGNGKLAVKGVAFSVFPREVYAFLGTNGAGKTTTMSMLCQQFMPTGGSAVVNGYDIVADSSAALRSIGYCPQFDATLDLLTVEEHLNYYAAVHGINKSDRALVLATVLQLCELTRYRKSQAAQLSGGNRRKLSVAISLIGGPQIIFLDEPSAGMDPVARRGMWTTIQRAASHCSVVLTTHHLEEVEALADIVAIMVDGSLRCIGDKVHLKNKFGSGFEMSLRVADESYCAALEDFVRREMPKAELNEFKSNRYVYSLPRDVPLSQVFELILANKDAKGIIDYSVSQTSIEQVFLRVGEGA